MKWKWLYKSKFLLILFINESIYLKFFQLLKVLLIPESFKISELLGILNNYF